jgi:hypothetical protein
VAVLVVSTPRQKAKNRGRSWEYQIAKLLGGIRHLLSRAGDVEARGYLIECKYRKDAEGCKALAEWIAQAKNDAKKLGLKWGVAINFGDGSGGFVLIPAKDFEMLTRRD